MIDWSVDIEDYIWATGPQPQPEKQTEAVVRDLGRGGTLFVAHYLCVVHSHTYLLLEVLLTL